MAEDNVWRWACKTYPRTTAVWFVAAVFTAVSLAIAFLVKQAGGWDQLDLAPEPFRSAGRFVFAVVVILATDSVLLSATWTVSQWALDQWRSRRLGLTSIRIGDNMSDSTRDPVEAAASAAARALRQQLCPESLYRAGTWLLSVGVGAGPSLVVYVDSAKDPLRRSSTVPDKFHCDGYTFPVEVHDSPGGFQLAASGES